MKVSNDLRFPHPVLWSQTGDFEGSNTSFNSTCIENQDTGEAELSLDFDITNGDIKKYIISNKAETFTQLYCFDTFYFSTFKTPLGESTHIIPPGMLRGLVRIRPITIATERLTINPKSAKTHVEFGKESIAIPSGGVLAIGDEFRFEAGPEKLSPMESIFRLVPNFNITENTIGLGLDSQAIEIHVSKDLYNTIRSMRQTGNAKKILLTSVYFPAIIEIFNNLKDDPESFDQRRWHRIFTAKCRNIGLDIERGSPLANAQKVMNSPAALLNPIFSEISS